MSPESTFWATACRTRETTSNCPTNWTRAGCPSRASTSRTARTKSGLTAHADKIMRAIWTHAGGHEVFGPSPRNAHIIGTCRMGVDPVDSVVDADGAVHDVPGLYICDNSTFPSALSGQSRADDHGDCSLRTADRFFRTERRVNGIGKFSGHHQARRWRRQLCRRRVRRGVRLRRARSADRRAGQFHVRDRHRVLVSDDRQWADAARPLGRVPALRALAGRPESGARAGLEGAALRSADPQDVSGTRTSTTGNSPTL